MTMLRVWWRAGVVSFAACAALAVTAQTRTLNPTVRVLGQPAKPVPAECAQGLAPATTPRINVAEIPSRAQTAAAPAPPSRTLRTEVLEVQDAAQRRDRASFREALDRLKATLATYPAGGERDAAQATLRVYNDLDRLWTYEFETPSGAFFDESTGLLSMMNGYPGWSAAVADQIVTSGGVRLYPSRESRDFLVREAARRAAKLTGAKVPAATTAETRKTRAPKVATTPTREPKSAEKASPRHERKSEGMKSSTAHARKPAPGASATHRERKPVTKIAEATKPHSRTSAAPRQPKSEKPSSAPSGGSMKAPAPVQTHAATPTTKAMPTKTEAPKVAHSTPATTTHAQPSTTTHAERPTPAPAVTTTHAPLTTTHAPLTTTHATSTAATSTTSSSTPAASTSATSSTAPPASSTSASTSTVATGTASATSTTTTDTTASATTSSAPATESTASTQTSTAAEPPPARKNVMIPIALIIIGLGVLVVLFRASGQ